jgi:hypothetical protein
MAVRLSILCASRPLPPGRFQVLTSVKRATVQLQELGQWHFKDNFFALEDAWNMYTHQNLKLNFLHNYNSSSYTRHIHKISSIYKYCHCNAAVTKVRMRAEFVGPFGRHRHNLQTIEPCLRIVLCVYNVQENRETSHMWNVVCNPFLECKKQDTGWHSSSTLWGV